MRASGCRGNRPRRGTSGPSAILPRQQHGVAVAVEAQPRLDGLPVGGQDTGGAGEGGDQHQQRALRQMEVGEQAIDHPEVEAGADEEPALSSDTGSSAWLSRARTTVVPTATTGRPLPTARAVASGTV